MPCDSRIEVKVTDANRLMDALKASGYAAVADGQYVHGQKDTLRLTFQKSGAGYIVGGNTRELSAIMRKYAEIGVRTFARSRGYTVTESDGVNMTLINRRG